MESSYKQKKINNFIFDEIFNNFRNMSIITQMLIIYMFNSIIFAIILIIFKYTLINIEITSHIDTDIEYDIYDNILYNQLDTKFFLDQQNTVNYNDYLTKDITLSKILFLELKDRHIEVIEISLKSLNSIQINYSNEFNKANFLINETENKLNKVESNNYYKEKCFFVNYPGTFFTFFYYHIIPTFYQSSFVNGLVFDSFYFSLYSQEGCHSSKEDNINNKQDFKLNSNKNICNLNAEKFPNNKNLFFKYPLVLSDNSMSKTSSNFKYKDTIIDPIGCFNESTHKVGKTEEDLIKRSNWFYHYNNEFIKNLENNKSNTIKNIIDNSLSKSIKLLRIGLNLYVEEYILNFKLSKTVINNQDIIFLFANKYNKITSIKHYLRNNIDTQNIISAVYSNNNYSKLKIEYNDSIYFKEYNIDDNNYMLFDMPLFLSNLFKYTFFPENINVTDTNNNIYKFTPDINASLLSIDIIKNVFNISNYKINNYFKKESYFYELIAFYLNYSLSKVYNKSIKLDLKSNNQHSCYYSDLSKYLNSLDQSINCLSSICGIIDCESDYRLYKKYYVNPSHYKSKTNCFCLPLLCYDDKTIEERIPEYYKLAYKVLYKEKVGENSSNLNTNEISTYSNEIAFNCIAYFKKKNFMSYQSPFFVKFNYINNKKQDTLLNFIYMSIEDKYYSILQTMNIGLNFIISLINILYGILVLILIVIQLKDIYSALNLFKNKVYDIKNIHKQVLQKNNNIDNKRLKILSSNNKSYLNNSFYINNYSKNKEYINIQSNSENLKDFNINYQYFINNSSMKKQLSQSKKSLYSSNVQSNMSINNENKKASLNIRYFDEIDDFKTILDNNINYFFSIDFSITRNIYLDLPVINIYKNYIKKKIYSLNVLSNNYDCNMYSSHKNFKLINNNNLNNLFPRNKSDNSFIEENDGIIINKFQKNKDDYDSNTSNSLSSDDNIVDYNKINNRSILYSLDINCNISIQILSEILSLEHIKIENYIKNFYFKGNQTSIFDFSKIINYYLTNDDTYINELFDKDKINSALNYINDQILLKWVNIYEKHKESI